MPHLNIGDTVTPSLSLNTATLAHYFAQDATLLLEVVTLWDATLTLNTTKLNTLQKDATLL